MENLTGGTPPVRYLPCVVPCKLYFAPVEETMPEKEEIIADVDDEDSDIEDEEYLYAINTPPMIDDYGYRMFYVSDEELRKEIHFLRDCRNTLAHGSACTASQVKQILG